MLFVKTQGMKNNTDFFLAKANTFAFSILQLKLESIQSSVTGLEILKGIKNLFVLPCELS
jgi:hypothetical protein